MEIIVRRYRNLDTGTFVESAVDSEAELAMARDGQYEAVAELSIGQRDTLKEDTGNLPVLKGELKSGYTGSITDEQFAELTKIAEVVLRKQKPETIAVAKADLLEAVLSVDPDGLIEACEQFRILALSVTPTE